MLNNRGFRIAIKPFGLILLAIITVIYVSVLVKNPHVSDSRRIVPAGMDPFTDEMPASATLDTALGRVEILRQARSAAREGRTRDVKRLIRSGLNVDENLGQRQTMLMLASLNGRLELAKYLIGAGSNTEALDSDGDSALSIATENGNIQNVDLLLKANPKQPVNSLYGRRKLPVLTIASENGDAELTRRLIQYGVNVNARDTYQRTALMAAVAFGHLDVAKCVIGHGADVNAVDTFHHRALWYARDLEKRSDHVRLSRPMENELYALPRATPRQEAAQRKIADEIINLLRKAGARE